MLKVILNRIGVKENERKAFTWVYLHSFLNGVFISFFATVAYAEFLSHHDTAELPFAFLISGVIGSILVAVYSKLQRRIPPARLYFFTLAFLLGLMIFLRVIGLFAEGDLGFGKANSFILFVAFAPAQQLLFLEFGGVSLQVFDIRQGKRFFGLISTGDIIAAMLGFLIVPVLVDILPFGSHDLLVLTILVLLACMWVLRSIFKTFPTQKNQQSLGEKKKGLGWSQLKNPYILSIGLLSLFSVLTAFFADYLFLGTIKLSPDYDSEIEMAKFIGSFFGLVKLVELALSLLSAKILSQLGMKVGIITFPLMMFGILLAASIAGFFFADDVSLFFFLIAFSQIIDRAVRKGIDIPAFRTLYQPMPDDEKLEAQTIVDGTVNQAGLILSGALLLVISFSITEPRTRMVVFAAVCVPFMLLYFLVALKMFTLYKGKLKNVLLFKNRGKVIENAFSRKATLLAEMISSKGHFRGLRAKMLYQTYPHQLESNAAILLTDDDKTVVLSTLKTIRPMPQNAGYRELVSEVAKRFTENDVRLHCEEVLAFFEGAEATEIDNRTIQGLCDSERLTDKVRALKYLFSNPDVLNRELCFGLLQSRDDLVIRSFISLVTVRNIHFTFPFLNELLAVPRFRGEITTKLVTLEETILPFLTEVLRKHQAMDMRKAVVEICEVIGSKPMLEFLFDYFLVADKWMQLEIGSVLALMDYVAESNEQRIKVKEVMRDTFAHIVWINAVLQDIALIQGHDLLRESMIRDKSTSIDLMFRLLGVIEDHSAAQLIEENVTGENKVFALEIIDTFVSEDIREYLTPLIEESGPGSVIKGGQDQFSQPSYSVADRLRNIVNHDYKKVSLVTKSLAIQALAGLSEKELPNEIFAGLYHHDELLFGPAARALIKRKDPKGIDYILEEGLLSQSLIQHIGQGTELPLLLSDKLNYFQTIELFKNVDPLLLAEFVRDFKTLHSKGGRRMGIDELYEKAFVVVSGSIEIQTGDKPIKLDRNRVFLDGLHFDLKNSELINLDNLVVLVCDGHRFVEQIVNFGEVLQEILNTATAAEVQE